MDSTKFPPSLKTKPKRIDRARNLVEKRFGIKTTKGELASFQGMWSETYIVSNEDGEKVVVQFRAEPLDIIPFQSAKKLLGSYVPDVELLQDEELTNANFYPVYLSYIPGHSWCTDPKSEDPDFNTTVMSSLGKVLARCTIDEDELSARRDDLVSKLERRLASKRKEVNPYRDFIRDLKEKVETSTGLSTLPLFQSHMDLNVMNIMINNRGDVTGIVDWELSPPCQPFGVGLHRIHELAGSFNNQIYRQKDEYYEMEAAFWNGILSALPTRHRHTIDQNLEAVQLAITVGTVLWAFDFDTGVEFVNPAVLAALPKFLSYHIPALRGDAPAYSDHPIIRNLRVRRI